MGYKKRDRGRQELDSESISLDFEGVGLREDCLTKTNEGFTDSHSLHIDDHKQVQIEGTQTRVARGERPRIPIPFEVKDDADGQPQARKHSYGIPVVGLLWVSVFLVSQLLLVNVDLQKGYFFTDDEPEVLTESEQTFDDSNIVTVPELEEDSPQVVAPVKTKVTLRKIQPAPKALRQPAQEKARVRLTLKGNFKKKTRVYQPKRQEVVSPPRPRPKLTRTTVKKAQPKKIVPATKTKRIARSVRSKKPRSLKKRRARSRAARSVRQAKRKSKRSSIKITALPVIIE